MNYSLCIVSNKQTVINYNCGVQLSSAMVACGNCPCVQIQDVPAPPIILSYFFQLETNMNMDECGLCYNNVETLNDMVWCCGNAQGQQHGTCVNCVKRGVEGSLANVGTMFKCTAGLGDNACNALFNEKALRRALDPALLQRYDALQARMTLRATFPADQIWECRKCDNAMLKDHTYKDQREMTCTNCNDKTCTSCGNDAHPEGRPCNPEHHQEAESATEAYILTCECGLRIERGDGCNHVTCRCKRHYCWICKERISSKKPYSHFSDRGGLGNCPTYGERPRPKKIKQVKQQTQRQNANAPLNKTRRSSKKQRNGYWVDINGVWHVV